MVLMAAWLVACGAGATPPPRAAVTEEPVGVPALNPPPALPSSASSGTSSPSDGCLVLQGDFAGQPAVIEGTLSLAKDRSRSGSGPALVLRLTRPRCTVGLPRVSIVTEVAVAATAADLRPFVDQRIRITGDLLGGEGDMGGAAVVILAKDVVRLDPKPTAP